MPRKSGSAEGGLNIPIWVIVVVLVLIFTPIGGALKDVFAGDVNLMDLIFGKKEVEPYYGSCSFKVNQIDYLATGSASPTNAVYMLYHEEPKMGASGESITASGTTTAILKADDGYVWFDIYGGDDFYVYVDALVTSPSNERIVDWKVVDWDQDGDEDLLVKLYVGDVGERGQGLTPTCTISLPLIDLDKTGWTDDNPADQTGIGETEVVKTITWKISGLTAEDGGVITQLYFTTNVSREGEDISLEEVTISGGWKVVSGGKFFEGPTYFKAPIREESGNYDAYYLDADDDLDYLSSGALLVWRGTNADDSLYIALNVRCTFETNDVSEITLNLRVVDPTGAKTDVSDAVCLCEA